MPLLLFTQHYPPDPTSTADYMATIADEIAQDREVLVFSGTPGSAALKQPGNVQVMEIGRGIPAKAALLRRVVAMVWLSVRAFFAALRHAGPLSPVLVVTTPFLLPYFTVLAAKLRGAPSALILYDLYPEVLVAAGLQKEGSLTVRAIRRLNQFLFRNLTCVVAIGRDMDKRLLAYSGCTPEKIVYIPNWATLEPGYRPATLDNPFRKALAGQFVVGMSGNLGFTHDPVTPVEAAVRLAGRGDVHFILSGWGAGWQQLRARYQQLRPPNITLIDRVPEEQLRDFLAAADAWIIPYRRGMAGVSVPSRLYNLLAIGRPIIALSEPEAEHALIASTEDVGWICPPEDPQALAALIERISADPEGVAEKGRRAAAAVATRYGRAAAGERYRALAERLVQCGRG
jgi:colanic acid biosynthesis glycosyl transferase WcaI